MVTLFHEGNRQLHLFEEPAFDVEDKPVRARSEVGLEQVRDPAVLIRLLERDELLVSKEADLGACLL